MIAAPMHSSSRRPSGFSLIELMITVAIIGILAAIAIPAYNGYIETAHMAAARTNLANLRVFLEDFYYDKNTYVAGTYDPAGDVTTLPNALGWRPDGDNDQFVYTVAACTAAGGSIANCYTITVTGFDGMVTDTFTKAPPP